MAIRRSSVVGALGADGVVADEVPIRPCLGLAAVMEQGGHGEGLVAGRQTRGGVEGAQRVLPEVDARPLVLTHAELPREEGKERRQQARLGQHAEASRRLWHRQHLAQLLADPLWRDRGGMRGSRAQRRQRGRFDLEVELGRQPHGTQQAEGVLVEALGRIADRAKDPPRQVAAAVGGIDQLEHALAATAPWRGASLRAGRAIGQGIDGEVAPRRGPPRGTR